MGFRAVPVKLVVAVAIAISLIVSIATAEGPPLLSFLHKESGKARFFNPSPVFLCVLRGEKVVSHKVN